MNIETKMDNDLNINLIPSLFLIYLIRSTNSLSIGSMHDFLEKVSSLNFGSL